MHDHIPTPIDVRDEQAAPVPSALTARRGRRRAGKAGVALMVALVLSLAGPALVGANASAPAPMRAAPAAAATTGYVGCTPPFFTTAVKDWRLSVFAISFCGTQFVIVNTRTGQRYVEGTSGWFCRVAPSWMVRVVTGGRYRDC